MAAHIPSLETLESDDDRRLAAELRLARLRSQAAAVRALADQVEALSLAGDADGLGDKLTAEAARLGYGLLQMAAALPAAPHSGDGGGRQRRQDPSGLRVVGGKPSWTPPSLAERPEGEEARPTGDR